VILHTILGKLFRIREDAHRRSLPKGADDGYDPDEKPFLDHLEDLRVMFMKIIVTLVLAMILCFVFRNDLLAAMRMPMVWAQIGNPDALAILIDRDKYEEMGPRFEDGDMVFLESGFIGTWRKEDREAQVTWVELAEGNTVMVRSDVIAGEYIPQEPKEKPAKVVKDDPAKQEGEEKKAPKAEKVVKDEAPEAEVTDKVPNPEAPPQSGTDPGTELAVESDGETKTPEVATEPVEVAEGSHVAPAGIKPELTKEEKAAARKKAKAEKFAREQAELQQKMQKLGVSVDRLLIFETFTPYEALVLSLKLAFFAGVVMAFPLLVWYVAQFVLPGLKQAEKKVVFPSLAVGFLLFLVGATFAYRIGLPFALRFLAEFTLDAGIKPGWRIGYYIKFVTQVILVFGLCFELPVVVMAMVKMELLTFRTMRDSRSYAIVALLCIAAIFTPPDPMTLMLLGGPLILLYEICIWLAWFMERTQLKKEAAEERARSQRLAELGPADEMSEDEKRDAAAEDIARYEAGGDSHDDPHHDPDHDENGNYIGPEHDPYHDDTWDHDHHEDDPHHYSGAAGMVDINHATVEELQQLPGIGRTLAERIVEGRPYYSEEELEYHANLPQSVIRLIIDRIYYG